MPHITVTAGAKQLHSAAYWKSGFYDEPTLVHLGTPASPAILELLKVLKARTMTPLPREFCLHWECNFDLSSVMDTLERHGFSLLTTTETAERVTYVFRTFVSNQVEHTNVQNGISAHSAPLNLPAPTTTNGTKSAASGIGGGSLTNGNLLANCSSASSTASSGSASSSAKRERKRRCEAII